MATAYKGHAEIVETLLNSVPQDNRLAIINHANRNGQTSLMAAAHQGHTDIVKLLLDALPEDDRQTAINHQDNRGNTARTLAVRHNHTEISDMLHNPVREEDGTNHALRHAATGGAIELPEDPPLLDGLTVFDTSLAENLDHDTASESNGDARPRVIR
jgi:ankyrin repeat protein